jgi:type IV secretion system protein VirB8
MNYEPDHDFDIDDRPVAASWHESVTSDLERSNKRAWLVAIIAAVIALLEAIALVFLIPLKTVEPYTLLVDRQTGNVETLKPLGEQQVTPDEALIRSFLVQYVTARESFAINSLQDDYRKVSLWSDKDVARGYASAMDAENYSSPLATLPRGAVVRTEVKSVSQLAKDRAMVRFTTTQRDPGGLSEAPQHWVAVLTYKFSSAKMSEDDRYLNPLGFQVTSYRRDAETLAKDDGLGTSGRRGPAFSPPPEGFGEGLPADASPVPFEEPTP